MVPNTLSFSAELVHDIKIIQYNRLGAATIVFFEYITTFDREVELIWGSRWSFAKVLFVLNRYSSLIELSLIGIVCLLLLTRVKLFVRILSHRSFHITKHFVAARTCGMQLVFTHWEGWVGLGMNMLSQMIMQLRVYALYSLNKKVLVSLGICFIICSSISGWIVWAHLPMLEAIEIPGGTFCASPQAGRGFDIFFLPLISFEFLLCAMALAQAFREFKATGSFWHRSQRLIRVLIRDSIFYFLIVSATYTFCVVWWAYSPASLVEAPMMFAASLCTITANRIVFNLRAAAIDESPIYNSSLFS